MGTKPPKKGTKNRIDHSGLSPLQKSRLNQAHSEHRAYLESKLEAKPKPDLADDESLISPTIHNAWIFFSGDKPGGSLSGRKAQLETQCAQLYLCVGKMGGQPDSTKMIGNNLKADAAGIMINQKTDVDKNYDLTDGTVGHVTGKSAVGIKADSVRLIGREGIKLVTNVDSRGSQGQKIESYANIELIAGNDDSDMQPLVKGDNLVSALARITESISDFIETTNGFVRSQIDFNRAQQEFNQEIAVHVHPVAGPAATLPVPGLVAKGATSAIEIGIVQINQIARTVNMLAMQSAEIEGFVANRMQPISGDFINSKNCFTN
jgi:hypothetical protein